MAETLPTERASVVNVSIQEYSGIDGIVVTCGACHHAWIAEYDKEGNVPADWWQCSECGNEDVPVKCVHEDDGEEASS